MIWDLPFFRRKQKGGLLRYDLFHQRILWTEERAPQEKEKRIIDVTNAVKKKKKERRQENHDLMKDMATAGPLWLSRNVIV